METNDLKRLTERFSREQIESCIRQQVEKGENACEIMDQEDDVIAALSQAEVMRELMDQGMKFSEALRELGRRIRAVYGTEENPHGGGDRQDEDNT